MSTKSRQSIFGGPIMGAKIRATHAREVANKALRRSGSLVDPDGRLWRTRAAVADHRAVPPWPARWAGGEMQPLQDPREPAARRDPPTARHAALEARGLAEVPVMPEG